MKGTETNPTAEKWVIISSALEKSFYDVILSNMEGGIVMILNENPHCLVKWESTTTVVYDKFQN